MAPSPAMTALQVMIAGSGHMRRQQKNKHTGMTKPHAASEQAPSRAQVDHKAPDQEKQDRPGLIQRFAKATRETIRRNQDHKAEANVEREKGPAQTARQPNETTHHNREHKAAKVIVGRATGHAQSARQPEGQKTTTTKPLPRKARNAQHEYPDPGPSKGVIRDKKEDAKQEDYPEVFAESSDDEEDIVLALNYPLAKTSSGPPSWPKRRFEVPARARISLLTEGLRSPRWQGYIVPQQRNYRSARQCFKLYVLWKLARHTVIPVFMRRGVEDWGFEPPALASVGGFLEEPIIRVWRRG